jgi:hypothetical protein
MKSIFRVGTQKNLEVKQYMVTKAANAIIVAPHHSFSSILD